MTYFLNAGTPTGLLEGSGPIALTLIWSSWPLGPGSTGKYLFTHVNYPQGDSAEVTPDTVGTLPALLSRAAFVYSHRVQLLSPNSRRTLGRSCFSSVW